jgi:hypothetical protein
MIKKMREMLPEYRRSKSHNGYKMREMLPEYRRSKSHNDYKNEGNVTRMQKIY